MSPTPSPLAARQSIRDELGIIGSLASIGAVHASVGRDAELVRVIVEMVAHLRAAALGTYDVLDASDSEVAA